MATLTVNVTSPASLSISGTTQKSTTISWSLPSVPSGATITSRTLTGVATASMNKGSATITVNSQTVYSGSNFTINLSLSDTTSSVTATAKGGNKNASGTVTFSNLVYTVNYTEQVQTYTVTFVDWDGTVLKTQEVEEGSSATAPTNPARDGYNFIGWDIGFTNVTSNLTVTAQYEKLYTVTFVDYDGTVLKTEEVRNGGFATAPEVNRVGYEFIGWSVDFSNVTSDITTIAQYKLLSMLKIKDYGSWVNIEKVYKKIAGSWVEQLNNNLTNLFNQNIIYAKKYIPIPTAVLYSDGTLIFSNYIIVDASHGDVVETYTEWNINSYTYGATPWYKNRSSIQKVYFNNTEAQSTSYWFTDCSSLTDIEFNDFDTSNVTNMTSMFDNCSSLTSLDLSSFDTSNVTSMSYMFSKCYELTSLDLSSFDTSNVTSMLYMFRSCSSLTNFDLSSFDTSNVTNMSYMFSGCSSLTSLDLSSFDTSNVTNMSNMFNYCPSLTSLDLSSFDTSNVTNMSNMFSGCTNPDLKIYVKDEVMATWVKSTSNFPSTATVIVGSPN